MENSLVVQLGMDLRKMEEGIHHGNELLEGFMEQIGEIGSGIAAAFAVEKIVEFGMEVSELAAKAHGVQQAFGQLPQSIELMNQLRETTHETVGDLELMGYAIHAQNLNIPLKDLGELLEFAHIRALQTNGDFNSLADTLITAIGKGGAGAKKAMKELQISTEDYTKALKETGNVTDAVMKLAREAIEKNKGSLDQTNLALEQNAAKWENFKIRLGEAANKSGILAFALNHINTLLTDMTDSDPIGKMNFHLQAFNDHLAQGGMGANYIKTQLEALNKQAQDAGYEVEKIYNASGELVKVTTKIKEETKGNADANKEVHEIIKNIAFYENEIKELRLKESEAIGQNLTNIQRDLELEQSKLDVLKLQYQTQRDMANTATANKMSGLNSKVVGPGSANVSLLPPSEDLERANTAIQKSIELLDQVKTKAPQYTNAFHSIFDEEKIKRFTDTLNMGLQHVISTLAEGIGEMAVGAASSDEVFAMVLQSAAGMLRQLGELAISAGITAIALENLLDNPYTAIAAGVALVALSGAVSGAAKNIMKGGSGGASAAHVSASSSSYGRPTDNSMQVTGAVKISGQDLWVVLSTYKTNSNYGRIG